MYCFRARLLNVVSDEYIHMNASAECGSKEQITNIEYSAFYTDRVHSIPV